MSYFLLLETGDFVLLETGDKIIIAGTPDVTTQPATSIGKKIAILNGHSISTTTITENGFEFGTVEYVDKIFNETGSFTTGDFDYNVTNLTANTRYYYRAYAINTFGTGYGEWLNFQTDIPTYNVSINGVDRTTDIINQTIQVNDILNDQQNTCQFSLIDRSNSGIPVTDQEIIITLDDDTILFGGYIVTVDIRKKEIGKIQVDISCVDYSRLLDRNLVNKTYTNQTDKAIIEDIIETYCAGFGITTSNVILGVTIDQINFGYIQPTQALRRIADLTGRNWYIDYSKDIHYFPLITSSTPFNIISTTPAKDYSNLIIHKDATQLKNRVYVRGGTKLSDSTTYSTKGDSAIRQFILPDKPHDLTLKVNGITKTVGIKNINTSGFDFYLNFQEKYVEQDSGAVILSSSDTLLVEYTYDIPILVAVEDTASISNNGQKEFAIFDKSITTQQAARDRASAELTDYANNIIEGSFKTFTTGFRSGQYININLTDYDINSDYIVTSANARSFGAGNYEYEIQLSSAKTMGIIRFLIELLESNKNLAQVNDQEVVDNLLSVTDSLLSDSITEVLTIDSAGSYSTWASDSLQSSPSTIAKWDLFQW